MSDDDTPTVVVSEMLGRECYVLIANPQHPLAARQTITAEEIERAEFIWPPRTSPYGEVLARMLAKAGVRRINIASRATDYEMIRESVMAGLGIACCAKKSVASDVAARRVVILALAAAPVLTLQVRLSVSQIKRTSPNVHRLIQLIRDYWGSTKNEKTGKKNRPSGC